MTAAGGYAIGLLLLLLCTAVPYEAYGWSLFGPKNYDDCVLDKIKDANTAVAVQAVKQSCRDLFPIKRVALPSSAFGNITVSDTEFTGQRLQITLHNNNHDWTVTNFVLFFSDTAGKAGTLTVQTAPPSEGTKGIGFELEQMITPYGKAAMSLNLDSTKAYNLWLSGVTGYQ